MVGGRYHSLRIMKTGLNRWKRPFAFGLASAMLFLLAMAPIAHHRFHEGDRPLDMGDVAAHGFVCPVCELASLPADLPAPIGPIRMPPRPAPVAPVPSDPAESGSKARTSFAGLRAPPPVI
jgi:hypothetical protein